MKTAPLLLLLLTGCSAGWWTGKTTMRTELEISPVWKSINFVDTKDNDITIRGLDFDMEAKRCTIEELTLVNRASDAIAAEVARIQAIGEAQLTQAVYVKELTTGLQAVIEALAAAAVQLGFEFNPPQLPTPDLLDALTAKIGGAAAALPPLQPGDPGD
jgi:hypothetical protein